MSWRLWLHRIDRIVGIEICLSHDSKTKFLKQSLLNNKGKRCSCLTTKWSVDPLLTRQTRQSTFVYLVFFHLLLLRKSQIDTTELYLYVTLHPCICCCRNASLHGIVRNQDKVSQAYEISVSKKRLYTKRTTLHFVIRNERFPLLKGTNNAFRIFMVLSETKSALVWKISQLYCLFTVWNSDVFSIYFFGQLDFFFRAT